MGKKKNRFKPEDLTPRVKLETKHSILGVAAIAIALFLFLARFHLAGSAGATIYQSTDYLIGAGFLLLPIVILLLGLSFFSASRPRVIPLRLMAGLILFTCGLGLLSLISHPWGGLLGLKLANLLIGFFDVYASAIFLLALGLGSLLLIFDINFSLSWAWIKSLFQRPVGSDAGLGPIITSPLGASTLVEPAVPIQPNQNQAATSSELKKDRLERPLTVRTKNYIPPPLNLLETDSGRPDVGDIKANSNIIKRTLANFGIVVEMDEVSIGPSITRYALKPAEGVKLARIVGLQNDLALALAAHPLRIEAPIPGRSLVGIEIPNTVKSTVGLGSLLASPDYQNSNAPLLTALGKGISGQPQFSDLAKAPHFLIAGATGSGKSVVIHNFVTSLLYRNPPERLRLIMIDPKQVELTIYNKIPHLLTPVITDPKKAILALRWAAKEMERRYNILEAEAVRNIESYHKNSSAEEPMPYIVIILDELAHIMSLYPREFEASIVRLAQMSRAVGIHLVLSTQRPSVEVITGLIKANIPCRIALQVASQVDSRTILDMAGAEKLLGAGDMLYLSADQSKPSRLQSAYVSEAEVKKVVKFLADQDMGEIEKLNLDQAAGDSGSNSSDLSDDFDGDDDQLYEEAKREVVQAGKASASYLQRKLKVGYARAARLLDLLEERGVIGPGEGAKAREIYGQSGDPTSQNTF